MKKLYTLLVFVFTISTFAQAPQGFNYQATVRNATGGLITNQNVYFKFNIMLNSQTSVPIYTETHYVPTDDLGQVNLVIGTGTASVGTFSTISWATGSYFLGIELKVDVIAPYVAMGTTQLLSVPYALYANSSGNAQAATPNLASVLAINNGANNIQIKNLADPTDAQDAVTKSFSEGQLQAQVAQLQAQINVLQNSIINVIPEPSQASICTGTNTSIALTSSINNPNITYSWTASCISGQITGFSNQAQSNISQINQVLTNLGSSVGIVRYIVTPHLGTITGQSVNVDVTVNGSEGVTTMPLYVASACQNQTPLPLSVGNPNPGYNYQWYVGAGPGFGILIPGATNSTYTPPTNNIGTTNYCCIVRSNPLNVCDFYNGGTFEFTVRPLPSIDNINVNINSSDTINLTPTNGGGINNSDIVPPNTIYSWTNNNASIGLAASGSGPNLIFTPLNNGTTSVIQILVVPSSSGCNGDAFTITFTINPGIIVPLPNVTIGTQIWNSTNLDVTAYRDGTPIPQVTDPTEWENLTTGAWCYYNNDPANGDIYGKLYNWYAVAGIHDNDPNTPNKVLAPSGWHVPNDAEWTTLTTYLGGLNVAGGKMKETGTTHWVSPNTSATNSSGFTGLPGGYRYNNGGLFYQIGSIANWWSSSEYDAPNALDYWLNFINDALDRTYDDKAHGLSVRCVKD